MECHNIVIRRIPRKGTLNAQKEIFVAKSVAFFRGEFKRRFESGQLLEEYTVNMNESHFVIDFSSKKRLNFAAIHKIINEHGKFCAERKVEQWLFVFKVDDMG